MRKDPRRRISSGNVRAAAICAPPSPLPPPPPPLPSLVGLSPRTTAFPQLCKRRSFRYHCSRLTTPATSRCRSQKPVTATKRPDTPSARLRHCSNDQALERTGVALRGGAGVEVEALGSGGRWVKACRGRLAGDRWERQEVPQHAPGDVLQRGSGSGGGIDGVRGGGGGGGGGGSRDGAPKSPPLVSLGATTSEGWIGR
ncbi:Protein of unknown function [Gryllus bimaculatus]|nr:Protein of unknown function [Gryllus bimaculatus]